MKKFRQICSTQPIRNVEIIIDDGEEEEEEEVKEEEEKEKEEKEKERKFEAKRWPRTKF